MALDIHWLTVDTADPEPLARFWAEALGYEITYDSANEAEASEVREVTIEPKEKAGGYRMLFLEVHDPKSVKNRLHLDLKPDDQDAEVARVERLGAKRVDIGQGDDVTWVVMADPDGNEFCILRPRKPSEDD